MQSLSIEYGTTFLEIKAPKKVDIRGMKTPTLITQTAKTIINTLKSPIDTPSLAKIAQTKIDGNPDAKAVIVVSDNTRPVPYKGKDGLMLPILHALFEGGFPEKHITILIGAGSHRNMENDEIEEMLGLEASGLGKIAVVNHEYDKADQLLFLGKTSRGSNVFMNKLYMEADLKIVTGLVESHFMAGASGGRKGICPGIVGKETLTIFHGAKLLNAQQAADLILEGNPLHEESSEVAQMTGCDFLVNATIDAEKRLTGVFAGDLFAAHKAAVQKIREYVVVELDQLYDIVLIPAAFVGINHYQGGKAAVEASRAVKPSGKIIIVGKHTDPDPIGGEGYKEALRLLHEHGREKFMEMILDPGWNLVQEQWQVQMWCKVLEVVERPENIIYCSLDIPLEEYEILPGIPGLSLLNEEDLKGGEFSKMERMVSKALSLAIEDSGVENPDILFLKDGPYGIPEVRREM